MFIKIFPNDECETKNYYFFVFMFIKKFFNFLKFTFILSFKAKVIFLPNFEKPNTAALLALN